jgi:hypothetical protein
MGKEEGGNGGVVVNIASTLGLEAFAASPVYAATKHAVIGLTRSFGVSTAYSNVDIPYNTMVLFSENSLLNHAPVSEFYMVTFRNTLFVPSSRVLCGYRSYGDGNIVSKLRHKKLGHRELSK